MFHKQSLCFNVTGPISELTVLLKFHSNVLEILLFSKSIKICNASCITTVGYTENIVKIYFNIILTRVTKCRQLQLNPCPSLHEY